ncbi:M15 family metallopeptidase [Marmoricola sp. RAF53]|uniref:M15 family metallopeptidase n=1 Tax=Marmoricola sp. RAF53 TaxID=3233059 RepID=UPI003F9E137A
MGTKAARWCALALGAALTLTATACGGSAVKADDDASSSARPSPVSATDVAMKHPGKFEPPVQSPDILVQSQDPLPKSVVEKAKKIKGVVATEQFSLATFYAEESAVTYAAVDPATFRAFTYGGTATTADVWDRVADGEIAVQPELKDTLATPDGEVAMGNEDDAPKAHLGAIAPLVDHSKIAAVVNEKWAAPLHMVRGNALLVSTGNSSALPAQKALAALIGDRGTATLLALNFDIHAAQTAVLTGGSVARAVGSFTYTANRDGTVNPDPRWVRDFIRTEQVPILGTVRCNKAMLPQLRAALTDIVRLKLTSSIHPGEYGGCYVPRYIARDPSKGLSFHTWGTAIDLNVPGNQRGTAGLIDRRVVDIFRRWGFNWGGTWRYTDPMHFELARIVKVG